MTETFSVLENTLRAYATSSKQAQGEVVVWRHPFLIMVLFGQLHVSLVLPRIKGPRCPSNRRLNGPQIWCERGEEKKKSSCPCRDFFFFRTLHRPARSIVTVLTELSRLLYVIQCFVTVVVCRMESRLLNEKRRESWTCSTHRLHAEGLLEEIREGVPRDQHECAWQDSRPVDREIGMGNWETNCNGYCTGLGESCVQRTRQRVGYMLPSRRTGFIRLQPSGHYMYHQFNIQQFYVLPTHYLCVLCGSQNKQPLFPYTALTDWFL